MHTTDTYYSQSYVNQLTPNSQFGFHYHARRVAVQHTKDKHPQVPRNSELNLIFDLDMRMSYNMCIYVHQLGSYILFIFHNRRRCQNHCDHD
jgi:hypothetical protein